jgi:hypothetical protein
MIALCFLGFGVYLYIRANDTLTSGFEMRGSEAGNKQFMPIYTGDSWKPDPTPDSEGFATALDNEKFKLLLNPTNTQIRVVDRRSGFSWRSNPPEGQLGQETVKGLLLSNLKSPFVLTYVRSSGPDQTRQDVTNVSDPQLTFKIITYEKGIQVTYTLPDKKLQFVVQYELTADGLKVKLPANGMEEMGEFAVYSIDLLPYFGAAKAGDDGYILVPDGPGGLIRFDVKHSDVSRGYFHQVYGEEVTNLQNFRQDETRRETIAYPVFGIKKERNAFLAIITEGEGSTQIAAIPSGLKSTFYQSYANFIYREQYLRKLSRQSLPIRAIQGERLNLDRSIEYRFLTGDEADYNGMARSYRNYLVDTKRLSSKLAKTESIPLNVNIMGGASRKAYNRIQYVTATTFTQAEKIIDDLTRHGIPNMQIVYYGWQDQGDYNLSKRFPIEASLGGQSAAKAFVQHMHEKQYKVMFEDDFVWIDGDNSDLSAKSNGIRGIDGTVFMPGNWFISKPQQTVDSARQTIERFKEIGVDGIQFSSLGDMIITDYDPKHFAGRMDTAAIYKDVLAQTKQALGMSGVFRGNDYSIGSVDFVNGLPFDSSHDYLIDETIPFYQIALHGYVSYSIGDGNLRNDDQTQFLKAIEYGAIPSFFLTYEDSRVLKDTGWNFLNSSQYEKWGERVHNEYAQFNKLSSLYNLLIVKHEKLTDERYATTYEDGTQVIVNYESNTFEVRKGREP